MNAGQAIDLLFPGSKGCVTPALDCRHFGGREIRQLRRSGQLPERHPRDGLCAGLSWEVEAIFEHATSILFGSCRDFPSRRRRELRKTCCIHGERSVGPGRRCTRRPGEQHNEGGADCAGVPRRKAHLNPIFVKPINALAQKPAAASFNDHRAAVLPATLTSHISSFAFCPRAACRSPRRRALPWSPGAWLPRSIRNSRGDNSAGTHRR